MQVPNKLCSVVVADDVRAARTILGDWLSELGMLVSLAEDGLSALALVNDTPPNLVVTDIEMPKMSGLELLRAIRESKNSEVSSIPVIVATSLLDNEISNIVEQFGGTTVVIKPLDKLACQAIVKKVLSSDSHGKLYDTHGSTTSLGGSTVSPTLRRLVQQAKK